MKPFLAAAIVLLAAPAWAQRTELALLAGYTSAGEIELKAPTIEQLEIAESFTWGLAAGRFFSAHWGAEVSWLRQESALELGTSSGGVELFEVDLSQLHGSVVYQFRAAQARLRPFLSAGLGASFFSSPGLEGETKLAWALGAGLKWFPRESLGVRLQARYNPTWLDDSSSDYCDPFGFCQDSLQQLELTGGVVIRF
jgi:opacity protein-like surface antigen